MAFCTKCGKELGTDGVCDCEKTQVTQTQEQKTEQATPVTEAPKKKSNKIVIVVIAAVAVALAVLLFSVFGGDSHEKPLKDLTKLINNQSTDLRAYRELLNAPMDFEAYESMHQILKNSDDYMEDYEDTVDELQDFYDDLEDFELKYDITKAKELKKRDLKDIQGDFEDSYNYFEYMIERLEDYDKADLEDVADEMEISTSDAKKLVEIMTDWMKSYEKVEVSEGYELTLRFYGEMDGDEDKTEKISDVQIVKMNGKWCIYFSYDLMRSMYFSDDLSGISFYELYNINGRLRENLGLTVSNILSYIL